MSSKIKDKVKASQIEWRRNQVISMHARGINQSAIARELQVSDASISLDIQFLKEQSQQVIKQYTTHDLPLQYQIALNALDLIIERSYKIVEKAEEDNIPEKSYLQWNYSRIHIWSSWNCYQTLQRLTAL